MLARLSQLDYDREMALAALETRDKQERMLGVGRLSANPDGTEAEMALAVGDPWQGKGIGTLLLEKLISIAAERGLKTLWGAVLPEDKAMLALGERLGFSLVPRSGGRELELRKVL
jgi:acetyltransferase